MCGRVFIKTTTSDLLRRFAWVQGTGEFEDRGPRFNGSPGEEYPLIVKVPDMPGSAWMLARWGFIPSWSKEENPKIGPISGKARRASRVSQTRTRKLVEKRKGNPIEKSIIVVADPGRSRKSN
jgi:putative SOS response-associated peptidase YedK